MPEDNFIYWDDMEWGYRIELAGYRVVTLAEDNNMSTYNLYVNSKHIEENNIIMRESVMLFPFRTIFESLGASVIWNE